MIQSIVNNSNSILYFDADSNAILNDIWSQITLENISKSNYNNHRLNSSHYIQSPQHYKPVLRNIYPIPPRSKWQYDGGFSLKCFQSLEPSKLIYNLPKLIHKLIKPLKNYKIGVELSGGLDSSIIISMLIANGIEPFLIGFSCDRYEFRTERYIQSIYTNKVQSSILLDSSKILPFQDLLNCPTHQLPNPTSLYYYSKYVTAKHCKENNVDILFNGMSGDTLFCDSVSGNSMPESWHNWMMDNRWFHENVFTKLQVKYLPVYTNNLASIIFKERLNMGFDSQKIWARQYFKNYLPSELVNYTYKADHVGDLIEGIKKSYFEVKELFKYTEEVTGNSEFSESSLSKCYNNIEKYHDNQLKDIMAKVSYAVWIYTSVKNLNI
jgi:hypothetical protein